MQEEDLETTQALGQTKTRWEMGAEIKRCRQGAHIWHYSCSYSLITTPRLWEQRGFHFFNNNVFKKVSEGT